MLKRYLSFLLICLAFASCKPDPCQDVDCNNGTCDSGDCICETGYEGVNCEVEQREAFVGDYDVTEVCDLGNFTYVISVTADSETGTELTIRNIGDFGFDVAANVDGSSFAITDQVVNGATVNGTGQLVEGTLTITYTMETTGGQVLNCTMTAVIIE